jgi:hypothetical protein
MALSIKLIFLVCLALLIASCDPMFIVNRRLTMEQAPRADCIHRALDIPGVDISDGTNFCEFNFKEKPAYSLMIRPNQQTFIVAVFKDSMGNTNQVIVSACGMGFYAPEKVKKELNSFAPIVKGRIEELCGIKVTQND